MTVIHIIDILLWVLVAGSVLYVAFFAIASLRRSRPVTQATAVPSRTRFLVIYPAYGEDNVIRQSVETFLRQDYSQNRFQLVVVSDHMRPETNEWLSSQPLILLQPTFEKSSKAKALQYAIDNVVDDSWRTGNEDRRIVILDADNVVEPDFLTRLDVLCQQGYQAIQCHRTAKNADNSIAALDGLSEEINNSLFRRAHNNIGLSSALIGSGMCFNLEWFASHVGLLSTAVEDRELEALLLMENIYVHYEDTLYVMDEKVSSSDNFQRQRLRWMTGQVQALLSMLPHIPHAIRTGNINYIDKTVQQMLIPRSILLVIVPFMALLISLLAWPWSLKWWTLLAILFLSLLVAIPAPLRTRALFTKALALPSLLWRMVSNIARINHKNTDFIHTTHNK